VSGDAGEARPAGLVFSQMLETCLAAPNCTAFVVWGFGDRQSWVPYYFTEYDAATLFDRAYRPSPRMTC